MTPASRTATRSAADLLPLKHSTYQVLLALAGGESHGYGIMQSLTAMTGGKEKILPGTLYASLARMVAEGLLEELDAPDHDASGGPKRRYYRCTKFGRAVAAAESERLQALVRVAQDHKLIPQESR